MVNKIWFNKWRIEMDFKKYENCIEACHICAAYCEKCATECLKEYDVNMMAEYIRLNAMCSNLLVSRLVYGTRE